MTKLQAIRSFVTAVLNEPTVIAKDRFHNNNFAMDVGNNSPRIKLPVSLNNIRSLLKNLFSFEKADKTD